MGKLAFLKKALDFIEQLDFNTLSPFHRRAGYSDYGYTPGGRGSGTVTEVSLFRIKIVPRGLMLP